MELLKIFGLAVAELQKHLRLENIVFHNRKHHVYRVSSLYILILCG